MSALEGKQKELSEARDIYWSNYLRKLQAYGFGDPKTELAHRLYSEIMVRYYQSCRAVSEERGHAG